MRIKEIRNPQLFQDFCQQLFAAEYKDFQSIDDARGDSGNDGYIPSEGILFSIYCPKKDRTPTKHYKRKIQQDFQKVINLKNEFKYKINKWIFVTPSPLTEELHRFISNKATKYGFIGISWSEQNIIPLLEKHKKIKKYFPDLIIPDIQKGVKAIQNNLYDLSFNLGSTDNKRSVKLLKPIELIDLLSIFSLDENDGSTVLEWSRGADLKQRFVLWKTRGIKWSSRYETFIRRGKAILLLGNKPIERLEKNMVPAYWDITLLGARCGISKIIIESIIISSDLAGLSLRELFAQKGAKFKTIKSNGNTDGYSIYKIKLLNKTPALLKHKWSCGSAGCSWWLTWRP